MIETIRKLLGRDSEESSKLWRVEDHRVEKVTVEKPISVHGVVDAHCETTRYQCIDCEVERGARRDFADLRCYRVIGDND